MRNVYYIICVLAATLCGGTLHAQDEVWNDTLMVYHTWTDILEGTPTVMAINPIIEPITPFDIVFTSEDDEMRRVLDEAAAVAMGDTTWMLNTEWLRRRFDGDCRNMSDYVPLFFNAKIAFVQWTDDRQGSILSMLLGAEAATSDESYMEAAHFYYIDFENGVVTRIDHKTLPALLSSYPDLLVRYQGMKSYKKRHVVDYYFREYLQRLNADPSAPYLMDQIGWLQ